MRNLTISLLLLSTLAACGFKGPLYLPGPTAQPAAAHAAPGRDASQPVQQTKDAILP